MTLGSIWAEWVSVRANSHPLNSSTKRYWFYLCAICVRALKKTGKPSALISALHSRKALSFKDIAEVSEQISHLLNCAMENNRKRKLQYLFSHVTLGWLLSKNRYRSASLICLGTDYRQYFGKRQTRLVQNSREWAADYDRPTIWCKYGGHECVTDSSIDPTPSEVDKPEETRKGKIRRTWEPIDKENCAAEVWPKCMQRHDNESSDLWRRQRPSLPKCAWHSYLHRSGDKTNGDTAREQSQQFVTTKNKL